MSNRKVVTSFWMKPIPMRNCDWEAHFDNYDAHTVDGEWTSSCPVGYGASEDEAIADLLGQVDDYYDPLTAVVEAYKLYRRLIRRRLIAEEPIRWPTLDDFVEAGWQRSDLLCEVVVWGDMWIDIIEETFGCGGHAVGITKIDLRKALAA